MGGLGGLLFRRSFKTVSYGCFYNNSTTYTLYIPELAAQLDLTVTNGTSSMVDASVRNGASSNFVHPSFWNSIGNNKMPYLLILTLGLKLLTWTNGHYHVRARMVVFVCSFVRLFVCSFVRLFVCLFVLRACSCACIMDRCVSLWPCLCV